jgi:hypothetical protein
MQTTWSSIFSFDEIQYYNTHTVDVLSDNEMVHRFSPVVNFSNWRASMSSHSPYPPAAIGYASECRRLIAGVSTVQDCIEHIAAGTVIACNACCGRK